jgi:hypothetical protein
VRASMRHAWPLARPTAISLEEDQDTHTAAAGDDAGGDDGMVASGLQPSSQSCSVTWPEVQETAARADCDDGDAWGCVRDA